MTDYHNDCPEKHYSTLTEKEYVCECDCHSPSKTDTGRKKRTTRPKKK